eukprot:g28093.t1
MFRTIKQVSLIDQNYRKFWKTIQKDIKAHFNCRSCSWIFGKQRSSNRWDKDKDLLTIGVRENENNDYVYLTIVTRDCRKYFLQMGIDSSNSRRKMFSSGQHAALNKSHDVEVPVLNKADKVRSHMMPGYRPT